MKKVLLKNIFVILAVASVTVVTQAKSSTTRKFPSSKVLVESGDKGLMYGSVSLSPKDRGILRGGFTLSKFYTDCGEDGCEKGKSKGEFVENAIFPVDELFVDLQDEERVLKSGVVIVTFDRRMFFIEEVFSNGRVAAIRVRGHIKGGDFPGAKKVPENSLRYFRKEKKENPYVIHVDDISGVQTKCFLGYCSGKRYIRVSGIPLCDLELLDQLDVDNAEKSEMESMICRVGGSAQIDAVFSDGAFANSKTVFYPFPETIHNYHVEQQYGFEEAN